MTHDDLNQKLFALGVTVQPSRRKEDKELVVITHPDTSVGIIHISRVMDALTILHRGGVENTVRKFLYDNTIFSTGRR